MAETFAPVTNITIPAVEGLARAINRTYNYSNNSAFGALIPNFYRDYYYRNVQIACSWLDGYVPDLHAQSGIISTRIASALISGLTKQIVGEQLVFKKASRDDDDDSLNAISKWAKDVNLIKAVFSAIGYAEAVGTSMIKLNKRMDGTLWAEAVRFDNFFYLTDFFGEVEEATFFMRNYVDTRQNGSQRQFVLVEHRWFEHEEKGKIELGENGYEVKKVKGEKTPMVCYSVHECEGTVYNNLQLKNDGKGIDYKQLPSSIRNAIKKDYSALRVNEPQRLPFPGLGVFALLNGETDLSIPTVSTFGKGMLIDVQDDLITYEVASSYLLRDMYLGKGTVYTPKDLNITDASNDALVQPGVMQGIGESKIEFVKGVSPDQQKIVVEQFQIRAAEWQAIKENCLKNIAVKWGMSPKILASFLAQGQAQQTATQIDSEDDLSIAFISHTRAYFKNTLNDLIETVMNYLGRSNDVEIDFASPSLVNKDRILDRTIKQLENGLIDIEEAVRILNPDLDGEALRSKIEKAKAARQAMALSAMPEMNPEGGFGNDYMDLGGANLNGSTLPQQ